MQHIAEMVNEHICEYGFCIQVPVPGAMFRLEARVLTFQYRAPGQ